MGKRVALVADGRSSDLYASFCAVKLAKRMDADLYSILLVSKSGESGLQPTYLDETWSDFSPSVLWQLICGLSSVEGVHVSYHLINRGSEQELADFLVLHKISCLITGTLNDKDFDRKKHWSAKIVEEVGRHPRWYLGNLTVFLAKPWNDESFKKILRQISAECNLYPIEIASA